MERYQITRWCQQVMENHLKEGSLCIDATMGNGNDTAFLCRKAGPRGQVLAFDIQPCALEHTKERLQKELPWCNYQLILDSHVNMERYAAAESVDCIVFNLGYLPAGDHRIATRADTSVKAIEVGLGLLKAGGIMSVCIYSGKDTGFSERDAVLSYLKRLDPRKYLVLLTEYYNRPNNPPVPAFIIRLS